MPQAANPPLLGKTPTQIKQILLNAGSPAAHISGPIISGRPGAVAIPGLALLSVPILVDYTMGNFSLPIQFPEESILLWAASMVYNSFTGGVSGDTTFQLGTANGRNDILAADGMGPIHTTAIHPVTGTLPFAVDPNPFQCWITVNNEGNTAGSGVVILIFMRSANLWT
jgi:hypothetical protein